MKNFIYILIFAISRLIGSEQAFIVGTTSGYAPYVSLNISGQYEGFDIDFAEELGKKLSKKIVLKDCGSMPALMLSLQQKKVDALIWAISITPERERKMDMIHYQGKQITTMPLLFWEKVPEKMVEFNDLQGYVVSVEAGSFQENVMKKVSGVKLKQVEKILDGIMEIRYGKSQAVLADSSIVEELKKKHPEIQVINMRLPVGDCSSGNGICINLDNPELGGQIRKAVQELKDEGRISDLEKKWGLR